MKWLTVQKLARSDFFMVVTGARHVQQSAALNSKGGVRNQSSWLYRFTDAIRAVAVSKAERTALTCEA